MHVIVNNVLSCVLVHGPEIEYVRVSHRGPSHG